MPMSNFSNFLNGVTIRGVPITQLHPGKVFYVNGSSVLAEGAVGGSNGNSGSYTKPFATIVYALTRCLAGRGDIILVMPGHTETISGAGTITAVAGVAIVGLGTGTARPTLTFSATTSTVAVSAANFTMHNILCLVSIDAVVKCFNVTAANFTMSQVDYQLTSAKSPVTFLVTSAAGTDMVIRNCRHYQNTAVSVTKWIDLVGADRALIEDNIMLVSSSIHVVGGTTTASLDVVLRNNIISNVAVDAASVIMLAATTGVASYNGVAGAKSAIAGTIALAGMFGFQNFACNTANKNGLLDPVVDS
jgi:hypothetical protein